MATVQDAAPTTAAQITSLRECPDCGLFQSVSDSLSAGWSAECARCGRSLRHSFRHGIGLPLACACVAAVLLVMTLDFPIMSLHMLGRFSAATLFRGPQHLAEDGTWLLALLVVTTLIAAPIINLALLLIALVAVKVARPSRSVAWLFGWLERISPWSMLEVFLVGALVAYSRLSGLAEVDVGPSLIAASAFVVAIVVAEAALDRELVWRGLAPAASALADRDMTARSIGCDVCGLVTRAWSGERCPRCRHALGERKENSVARVWACVVAAAILYVPANALPVMTIVRLGRGGARTILGGVVELANDHLWPLAILVFLASVAIPLLKLAALTALLVMTARRSPRALVARTRLYKAVRAIGRWSMIDIFMLTTLVGLLQLGRLATVLPEHGALAFAGVVVLTMLATEWLDPRLMWDAAGELSASQHAPSAQEPVAT
jgi:paraquat-inducible protein A